MGVLGRPGSVLGRLGEFRAVLGASWAALGPSWGPLGGERGSNKAPKWSQNQIKICIKIGYFFDTP